MKRLVMKDAEKRLKELHGTNVEQSCGNIMFGILEKV